MWVFLITQEERSQVVLPFLYSRERAAAVFSGIGWVSFFSPQIISGVCGFVGVGSVGSFCFISAKGCELPVWGFRGSPLLCSSSPIWMPGCWISLMAMLVMRFEAFGCGSASGWTKAMNPTAVFSSRASLAASQCLVSDYRFGWARFVVCRLVCDLRRVEELRLHVQWWKMTSRVLVVIFYFLRVLYVKVGCTVLTLS